MDIHIEIDNTNVNEREISTDRGSFTVRDQVGWLKLPEKCYPQEIVVSLEQGQAAYSEGTYRILEGSVMVDKYKRIAFQHCRSSQKNPLHLLSKGDFSASRSNGLRAIHRLI